MRNLGIAYASLGQNDSASSTFHDAIALQQAIGDGFGEAQTHYDLAGLQRKLGKLTEARAELEKTLGIVESLRSRVVRQDLRSSYFAKAHDYYSAYIDTLARLDRQQPSSGFAAIALEASERARARVLLDALEEAHVDIRQGVDPALLAQEKSIERRIGERSDYRLRVLGRRNKPGEAATLNKELEDLLGRYATAEAVIRAASPDYASLTQPRMLSAVGIQRQIVDANTLLLEYFLGRERSYLWVVDPNTISLFELPSGASIEAAVRRFYALITAENAPVESEPFEESRQDQIRICSKELSRILLLPARKLLGGKRLLIVADGVLQYLPFGSLPAPGAESGAAARPLIAGHEIVILPSVTTLVELRRELVKTYYSEAKAIIVFADPVVNASDARLSFVRAKSSNAIQQTSLLRSADLEALNGELHLTRLPLTRREAESIADLTGKSRSVVELGFDASRDRVMSGELADFRIVHFATHGVLDMEHPELSGLVLSEFDRHGRRQDGFLKLQDIYNLKLSANLVVLSACQTALGQEIRGEGLISLTHGFMYAGATTVVASLWKVDDAATLQLMNHFYRAMFVRGLSPAAALRLAKIQMYETERWASPYYWAGFTLQGEWRSKP